MHPLRYTFITLLVVTLLSGACKKATVPGNRGYPGIWEIKRYSGYPFPAPYPPGNGNLLILYKDGGVEQKEAGVITQSGHFTLSHKKDCYPRENTSLITFHFPANVQESYIELHDNNGEQELWLGSSNCLADAGAVIYRRIQ